jgi:hypothetical protein
MGVALWVGTPKFISGEQWKRISVDWQVASGGMRSHFLIAGSYFLGRRDRLMRHGRAWGDRLRMGSFF